jgi:hypothetical protein
MLADSTRFVLHAGLSTLLLFHLVGGLSDRGVGRTLWKSLLAATIMGVAISVTAGMISPGEDTLSKTLTVALPAATGLLTYAALLSLLGIDDLRLLLRVLPGSQKRGQ